MAMRREDNNFGIISKMPWQIGIVLGLVAFFMVNNVIGWILVDSSNPFFAAIGNQAMKGGFCWIAIALLVVCWAGALASFLGRTRRARLLKTQSGLDRLRAMNWREFEMLVGEAYRHRGYGIEEVGLGGADGGIDLVLRKDGAVTLVQCKQWRQQRVDVRIVREMYGLMAHHKAQSVKIVCIGDFTPDARRFAQGKPIELIHGEALLAMIQHERAQVSGAERIVPTDVVAIPSVPVQPARKDSRAPECPRCGSKMDQRSNRKTGESFWGCTRYPACRGTRPF